MKILLAHSDPKLAARVSIDLWRIIRPFEELKKHTDWQIDNVPFLIPDEDFEAINKDLAEHKIHPKLLERIKFFSNYDIIWTSYFTDAALFDVVTFACEKYGTKFVVDVDDDFYHLPKHNHFWTAKDGGYYGLKQVHWMLENSKYVVTSTPVLQKELSKHRKGKTYILPNYIGKDYKHKKFDNKDKIVISYFGSITHKRDVTETGLFEALQQIMHKYKNVHVGTVGVSIDAYLPKQRYEHFVGKPGYAWTKEVWPNINADICVAPLEDNTFNRCKSNIKWLETAMIPAAFVASNIPPYKGSVKEGVTGLLTNNTTEDWYEALEKLVTDKSFRTKLADNAKKEIEKNWMIENNWQSLKKIVEEIHADNSTK